MRSSIKTPRMMFAGLAVTALLAAPALAACSNSDSAATSSSSSSAAATPVAKIDALTGQSTAVKLDAGFLEALTTLKLAPGTVGTAKLTDGSLIFPITGGNVTYYTPGSVTPYVTGDIKHTGSGFSLTAGATKVNLTNFDIDPGTSKLYGDVAVTAPPPPPTPSCSTSTATPSSRCRPAPTTPPSSKAPASSSPPTPPACSTTPSRPTPSKPAPSSASPRSPSTPSNSSTRARPGIHRS